MSTCYDQISHAVTPLFRQNLLHYLGYRFRFASSTHPQSEEQHVKMQLTIRHTKYASFSASAYCFTAISQAIPCSSCRGTSHHFYRIHLPSRGLNNCAHLDSILSALYVRIGSRRYQDHWGADETHERVVRLGKYHWRTAKSREL